MLRSITMGSSPRSIKDSDKVSTNVLHVEVYLLVLKIKCPTKNQNEPSASCCVSSTRPTAEMLFRLRGMTIGRSIALASSRFVSALPLHLHLHPFRIAALVSIASQVSVVSSQQVPWEPTRLDAKQLEWVTHMYTLLFPKEGVASAPSWRRPFRGPRDKYIPTRWGNQHAAYSNVSFSFCLSWTMLAVVSCIILCGTGMVVLVFDLESPIAFL